MSDHGMLTQEQERFLLPILQAAHSHILVSQEEGKKFVGLSVLCLIISALAITMAAVWWWPCGGFSLWWKIPLSILGLIITFVVGATAMFGEAQ